MSKNSDDKFSNDEFGVEGPAWADGKIINEAIFCEEFLSKHKIIFSGGSFFTTEGRVVDETPLKRMVFDDLKNGDDLCKINSACFLLSYKSDNTARLTQYKNQDISDYPNIKTTGFGMLLNVKTPDSVNPGISITLSKGNSTITNSFFEDERTDFYVPVTIGANKSKTDWTGFRVYRKNSSNNIYNVTYGVGFSGTTPTIAIEQKDADGSIRARLNVKGTVGSSTGELWLNNSLGGTAIESKKLGFGTSELTWGGSTVVVSSIAENKSNIQEAPSVLSLFSKNESKIYSYNFIGANNNISENETSEISTASVDQSNDGSADRNDSYGFVIGDGYNTPKEVLSSDEKHISLYSMAAITWKAVQELIEKNSCLEAKISEIETLIA